MNLNHQNFCWLMTVLGLPYTYESQAMVPAEVVAAIARFRQKYCYGVDPVSRKSWLSVLHAKRSPAPIMAKVCDALASASNQVPCEPDWGNLGDPFICGSEAWALREQLDRYITHLSQMSRYCIKNSQILVIS